MKLLFAILFSLVSSGLLARTITVGKDQVITSLRKGIETAQNGDTVLLLKGTYREGNIIINKNIHLVGVGEPILDGEDKYEILTISGRGIIVKGIHFRNSG